MSKAIPHAWRFCEFGDIAKKIEGGGTPARNNPEFWSGKIPWVTVKDLKKVRLSFAEESISELGLRESSSRLIPKNTLIIATRMALGKAVVFDKDVTINQDLKAVFPTDDVESEYLLQWYLSKSEYIQSMGTGSTVKGIRLDDLRLIPIKLPPLPEQQKIAAILTSVDDVIESTQAQINKLKDLKTGMMQELLTKGIGHTEFKDSAVGRIPKAWEVLTIGEIVESMDGGVSVNGENRPKQGNEYGVLKVSAVIKGKFRPNENKAIISSDFHRAKLNPLAGHVLFSRANTPELVGECGYVEETRKDLFLPDKLWMIKLNSSKNVDARWLSYVLSSGQTRERISEAGTGTSGSMKNISKPNLLSIKIGVPPEDEQRKISNFLLAVDKRIECCTEKLGCSANIKKALMQDLLTGKVRVNVN